ncbi:MAG: hypothetical protein ACXWYM_00005, partial [Candidatus Binatia bacterium]
RMVSIPSGMGGTFPAVLCKAGDELQPDADGNVQVICVHKEFYPDWLMTVAAKDVKMHDPLYYFGAFAKKIVNRRFNPK